MKSHLKAAASVLAALALTLAMLVWLTDLTERKDSDFKYAPFFDQDADLDVLFFGSSHVINGIYPMELWQDYGIVSYNFGGHANFLPVSYWVMRNALRCTTPKLVVVDCLYLGNTTKIYQDFDMVHLSMDAFPLSAEKIRAVLDLMDDPVYEKLVLSTGYVDRRRTRMGLLWDFSEYHDRWQELGESDFAPGQTVEKGAETLVGLTEPRQPVLTDAMSIQSTAGTEYLRRIIEECQRDGIDILLTNLPFPATEEQYRWANTAGAIAREYGVDYIDFLQTDTVSFNTDFFDYDSHLNASGARKVTDYLGQYIREHYDVPDRRDDPVYAGWNDDYAAYTDHKLELLEKQTSLKNYLMLLQDKHLSACLYLAQSELWTGRYRALLENIGIDPDALPAEGPALVLADRLDGAVSLLTPGQQAASGFGTVSLDQASDGTYAVRVGEKDALTLPADAVAGVVAMSDLDGKLAAPARFSTGPAGETKIT